jgi:DNA-binding IclR family transcriptional regulator
MARAAADGQSVDAQARALRALAEGQATLPELLRRFNVSRSKFRGYRDDAR